MFQPDPSTLPQKWLGAPTYEREGTFEEISALIPKFTRRPFGVGGVDGIPSQPNPLLDMIVREPSGETPAEMPVGVVSKSYNLLQHRSVLDCAIQAMKVAKVERDEVRAMVQMTENGERMALHLYFPERYAVTPADGFPMGLRLFCVNSVDGSLKFFATLGWFRLICGNGMIIGAAKSWVKERHRPNLDVTLIGELLKRDLVAATADKNRFQVWINTTVKPETLQRWVDKPLKTAWGVKAATRAYHIATTGYDADMVLPFEKAVPSRRQVQPSRKVPGAVDGPLNAYGVCQVLSWLAKERREMQEHLAREQEIEALIEKLIALN